LGLRGHAKEETYTLLVQDDLTNDRASFLGIFRKYYFNVCASSIIILYDCSAKED
jgi:hypothetical protein